ncbi:hypothetical protein U27_05551 [Candidatus Vecturithrix granuli]|uniref:Uncharacterized protein n=1 Tax=Vecturithrix granuli TaxID=1499967 RepID=A0A081C1X2_VECG1|nr:hypothetical protein U27_05551 [Candidatus Vecturithrix granuli]
MQTQHTERRPLRTVLLTGILAFLFLGTASLSTVTFGSSDAFYPDTTKEIHIMRIAQAANAAEHTKPPIDLAVPTQTQTATFALG